ncbi:MAG: DUF4124 domain-containing protein [Burkholderiaceae bacterium]|nr:DUF4124 domain-containing protein [Burkholderiaceae bacterium]
MKWLSAKIVIIAFIVSRCYTLSYAQSVNKCVSQNGIVTYSDTLCPASAEKRGVISARPNEVSSEGARQLIARQRASEKVAQPNTQNVQQYLMQMEQTMGMPLKNIASASTRRSIIEGAASVARSNGQSGQQFIKQMEQAMGLPLKSIASASTREAIIDGSTRIDIERAGGTYTPIAKSPVKKAPLMRTCQTFGSITTCSDGVNYHNSGQQSYGSDGSITTHLGGR